jgi:hypothetical protein
VKKCYNKDEIKKLNKFNMAEAINTLNAKNEIQAQLDGFNVQLLSTLPSLKNENIF